MSIVEDFYNYDINHNYVKEFNQFWDSVSDCIQNKFAKDYFNNPNTPCSINDITRGYKAAPKKSRIVGYIVDPFTNEPETYECNSFLLCLHILFRRTINHGGTVKIYPVNHKPVEPYVEFTMDNGEVYVFQIKHTKSSTEVNITHKEAILDKFVFVFNNHPVLDQFRNDPTKRFKIGHAKSGLSIYKDCKLKYQEVIDYSDTFNYIFKFINLTKDIKFVTKEQGLPEKVTDFIKIFILLPEEENKNKAESVVVLEQDEDKKSDEEKNDVNLVGYFYKD